MKVASIFGITPRNKKRNTWIRRRIQITDMTKRETSLKRDFAGQKRDARKNRKIMDPMIKLTNFIHEAQ